jgi:ABC-2 type transport system permease protein
VSGYLAIISARFRTLLQYRSAALAGLFTQAFYGVVRIMILEAFYRSSAAAQPMSFAQVVGYVWLGQAALSMFPWNVDKDIRDSIRSGAVVYELCRPLDLYGLWYARAIAWRTAPMLLRAVPMLVFAILVLPAVGFEEWALGLPHDAASGMMWLATFAGELLLSCAMSTLLHISLMWTISGDGSRVLLTSVTTLLGGMVIPLPLFPDWAQPILGALPFAGLMDLPARVYTGHIAGAAAWTGLLVQLGWTLALIWLGRAILARGTRRLVVQGG